MKKLIAPILLALAACHTTVQSPAATATPEQPGTFTVVGSAQLDVAPDTADLHVTLSSRASRPGAATKDVRRQESALIGAFAKLGLEAGDVKLAELNIQPTYDDHGRISGYESSIAVVATTHDFDRVGDLMEAAADAGASQMSSSFHADLPKLKAKARDMALAAAKDKAAQIAADLGISPGKVMAVSEDNGSPYYYGNVVANAEDTAGNMSIGAQSDTLQLSISVTYQIA